jgi:hypothetical protein
MPDSDFANAYIAVAEGGKNFESTGKRHKKFYCGKPSFAHTTGYGGFSPSKSST